MCISKTLNICNSWICPYFINNINLCCTYPAFWILVRVIFLSQPEISFPDLAFIISTTKQVPSITLNNKKPKTTTAKPAWVLTTVLTVTAIEWKLQALLFPFQNCFIISTEWWSNHVVTIGRNFRGGKYFNTSCT